VSHAPDADLTGLLATAELLVGSAQVSSPTASQALLEAGADDVQGGRARPAGGTQWEFAGLDWALSYNSLTS
jgi:hypothetical protein